MFFKKSITVIVFLVILTCSFVCIEAKEINYYCVYMTSKYGVILDNIKIDLYYSKDTFTNSDINQKEAYYIDSYYTNKDGYLGFYCEKNNIFIKIDLKTIPNGYGVKSEYFEFDYNNRIDIEIMKIIETKNDDDCVNCFDEHGKKIITDIDNRTIKSIDEKEKCYHCIEDSDLNYKVYNSNNRSIIFDQQNPSLSDIFNSTDMTDPIYNRFIICHNGINSNQIQMIADEIYAIEYFFIHQNYFLEPETHNGYYYIVVGNFNKNSTAFVKDEDGNVTQYSFMKINENLLSSNATNSYKVSISHEYFHSVFHNYEYNKSINHRFWLYENLATFAAFVYVNQIPNLSNTEINQIKSSYMLYPKNFYNNKDLSGFINESLFGYDYEESNEYSSFIFSYYIYQEYGGLLTFKKMFERILSSTTLVQPSQLFLDTLNYDCNYNIASFKDLYQDFCIFSINSSENYNCQESLKSILINNLCENVNDIDEYSTFSYHLICEMSYAVKRFDIPSNSRVRNKIILNVISNNLQSIYNDVSVILYYGNRSTGNHYIYNNPISQYTNINIYYSFFGVDYYDYCIVMIINKNSTEINISFENQYEYLPYDEAEYKIGCDDGNSVKYMTIPLDEYNCITLDRNVYLYDSLENNLAQCFRIKEISSGNYHILTKATSFYPEDFPNMRIGINNNNIYTICDGYYNDSLFGFYEIYTNYFKIYKYNNSASIVRAVNFNNGSNTLDQLYSNGNIILSNSFNNTYLEKWRFYPVEGV